MWVKQSCGGNFQVYVTQAQQHTRILLGCYYASGKSGFMSKAEHRTGRVAVVQASSGSSAAQWDDSAIISTSATSRVNPKQHIAFLLLTPVKRWTRTQPLGEEGLQGGTPNYLFFFFFNWCIWRQRNKIKAEYEHFASSLQNKQV